MSACPTWTHVEVPYVDLGPEESRGDSPSRKKPGQEWATLQAVREAVRFAVEPLATKAEVAASNRRHADFVTCADFRAAVDSLSAKAETAGREDLGAAEREALRAEVAALRRLLWFTWVGLAVFGIAVMAAVFCAGRTTPPCDARGRGDVANLAAVTARLRADVDALQEVRSTPRAISEGILRSVGAVIVIGGTFWVRWSMNGPPDHSCGEPKVVQSTVESADSTQ